MTVGRMVEYRAHGRLYEGNTSIGQLKMKMNGKHTGILRSLIDRYMLASYGGNDKCVLTIWFPRAFLGLKNSVSF